MGQRIKWVTTKSPMIELHSSDNKIFAVISSKRAMCDGEQI